MAREVTFETRIDPRVLEGAPAAAARAMAMATDPILADFLSALPVPDEMPVSNEMIMYIAERRLRDLDRQVRDISNAIMNRTATAREQAARLESLRELQRRADHIATDEHGNYRSDAPRPERWTPPPDFRPQEVPEGSGTRPPTDDEVWQQYRDAVLAQMSARGIAPSRSALQSAIDAANEALRQTNSNNEMQLVHLQSTMQQRTSAIQMTTNLLKALDEAADSVVANLR
jgi:hypothetical protein